MMSSLKEEAIKIQMYGKAYDHELGNNKKINKEQ